MKINRHVVIIIPGLWLLLCSCMPKYTVDFKNVEFTHFALDKTDFEAKIGITCKWFRSIALTDIRYQLYVKNKKFGEGNYPGKILLSKNADTLLSFPCTIKNQSIVAPLFSALLKGDFDYEVRMYLNIEACIFKKKINTKYWGTKKIW